MDHSPWPTYQGYTPIIASKREIRLMRIIPSSGAAPPTCSLTSASLNDKLEYCALSYYWGAPVPARELKVILIDGCEVHIRPTLEMFIRNLTTAIGPVVVWLDAICINQRDVSERGNQVALMGEIYMRAQTTYAWLGPGDADTDFACEHIGDGRLAGLPTAETIKVYVSQLFWRPYWRRIWVIQELVLSAHIQLFVGDKTITWEQLARIFDDLYPLPEQTQVSDEQTVTIFGEKAKPVHDRTREELDLERENQIRDRGGLYYHRIRNTRKSFTTAKRKQALLAIVHMFRDHQCTDDCDKIYGLLALAEGNPILPDYSITASELYFRLLAAYTPICDRRLAERHDVDIFNTVYVEKIVRQCVPLSSDHFRSCLTSLRREVFSQFFIFLGSVRRGLQRRGQENELEKVSISSSSLGPTTWVHGVFFWGDGYSDPFLREIPGLVLWAPTAGSSRHIGRPAGLAEWPKQARDDELAAGASLTMRKGFHEGDLAFRAGRSRSLLANFSIITRSSKVIDVAVRSWFAERLLQPTDDDGLSINVSEAQLIGRMLYYGVQMCKEGIRSNYWSVVVNMDPYLLQSSLLLFHIDHHVLVLFSL